MSIAELKIKLIEDITKIDDEQFLADALGFIREKAKGIYILSPDQIAMLKEAEAQYERGEYFTEEEADKQTEEWLKD